MGDKALQDLLKWSIEASDPTVPVEKRSQLTPEVIASLMGGPSEPELMIAAMEVVTSDDPEVDLESKITAMDNFEQMIENLDNANNMVNLKLWAPLLTVLDSPEAELRRMTLWCIGTAIQNNVKSQQAFLDTGGMSKLVSMAVDEKEDKTVRKKAVYALSSSCRNFQPAMDKIIEELGKHGKLYGHINAEDMDQVDTVILPLKEALV